MNLEDSCGLLGIQHDKASPAQAKMELFASILHRLWVPSCATRSVYTLPLGATSTSPFPPTGPSGGEQGHQLSHEVHVLFRVESVRVLGL